MPYGNKAFGVGFFAWSWLLPRLRGAAVKARHALDATPRIAAMKTVDIRTIFVSGRREEKLSLVLQALQTPSSA